MLFRRRIYEEFRSPRNILLTQRDFLKSVKHNKDFELFLNKKGYYRLDKIWDQYVVEHHLSPLDLEWINAIDRELIYSRLKTSAKYQLLNHRLYEISNEYHNRLINRYFNKIKEKIHDEDEVINLQKQSPSMDILMHTESEDWYTTNVLSHSTLIKKYLDHYKFYQYYQKFIEYYRTFDRDRDRFVYDDKVKYFTVVMLENLDWKIVPIKEQELTSLEFEFLRYE